MSKLTNKAIFEALDAAAGKTGIPALAAGQARRRHLRWLPVVALAIATIGMVILIAYPGRREILLGNGILVLGFMLALILPIIGPVKPWGSLEKVDEFDRTMRRDAFLAAFASASAMAVLGIWLMIGLALLGDWDRARLIQALSAFAFYLLTLYLAVPTLHASWTTRPIVED